MNRGIITKEKLMILQNSAILKWHVSLNLQITDYSHFIQTIAKHGKKWDAMQFISKERQYDKNNARLEEKIIDQV